MNILIFNCGSSSLKYRLIKMPDELEIASGEAKRVGPKTVEPGVIIHHVDGRTEPIPADMPDHGVAFEEVMKILDKDQRLVPDVFGHRLVHGGEVFTHPTIFNDERIVLLDSVASLAPLHNPPAFNLIKACRDKRPDLPQVGVFDTAFHATIPEQARTYALPKEVSEKNGIRKYGFHGTSHQYVVEQAATLLDTPLEVFNAVSCHLGTGGSSLCAVVNGRSVDNTMGYSPLQGLIMSTRCGDLDPALTLGLVKNNLGDIELVEKILNRQSGLLGISQVSPDLGELLKARTEQPGHKLTEVAIHAYLWRIKKYLGAYLAAAGKVGAIIFTDTVGETVPFVREVVCEGMQCFGIEIDRKKNNRVKEWPADVATETSAVRILVIKTNEELAIARQVYQTINHDCKGERVNEYSCI